MLDRKARPRIFCVDGSPEEIEALHERLLSTCDIITPAGRIDEIAERITDQLSNFDQQLWPRRWRRLWLASDLGELNPIISDFVLDCCLALIVLSEATHGHLVVSCSDYWRMRALYRVLRRNGIAANLAPEPAGLAKHWLRVAADYLRRGVAQLQGTRQLQQLLGRVRASAATGPHPFARLRGCDVILFDWANGANSRPGSTVPDSAFFGRLPTMLKDLGWRPGLIGLPLHWSMPIDRILDNIRQASFPAAVIQDGQRQRWLWLYWLVSPLFRLLVSRRLMIEEKDLSGIVDRYLAQELGRTRLLTAIMCDSVGPTLRRQGAEPRVFILPYENQPWERVLIAGLRRSHPSARIVGIQHSPLARLYLSARPGSNAFARREVPDWIGVSGQAMRDLFVSFGFPPDRVVPIGAFRFEKLLEKYAGTTLSRSRTVDMGISGRLLIACPMDIEQSIELIEKCAQALQGLPDWRGVINYHPLWGETFDQMVRPRIAHLLAGMPEQTVISTRPAEELFSQSDVVAYNGSGVGFEALIAGLPAIFVCSDYRINLNKLPDTLSVRAETAGQLRQILSDSIRHGHAATDQARLRQYFQPVAKELIPMLLPAHGAPAPAAVGTAA